jgi:hypothetical protein
MDYTASNRSFKNMVEQQLKWAGRVPCYPGIGVSASTSRFGPDQSSINQDHPPAQNLRLPFSITAYPSGTCCR